MNFVITGHTSGIGQAIHKHFGGTGLSTSTGFDITTDDIRQYMTKDTVFINNAFTLAQPDAQTRMLLETYDLAKHVINIGSNTIYPGEYQDAKKHLANTITELFYEGYNVTNIKLGKVDTPFQKDYMGDKISLDTIITTIEYLINVKERVHEISIRPYE